MERLIILDTETTGLEPSQGHRIIEIGCCEIIKRMPTDHEFHEYIQPNKSVGESVKIHGITDEFLKGRPVFEEIAEEFLEFIEGSTLVIHNAPFDLGFLNHELKLMGVEDLIENRCNVIDTLEMAKQKFPGAMHNLDALCRRFEIDASARTVHGALLDAQILSQVYIAMTGGQSNLFNESENKNPNSTEQMTPSSNDSWPELSIHYANETEVQEHANYFAKFN